MDQPSTALSELMLELSNRMRMDFLKASNTSMEFTGCMLVEWLTKSTLAANQAEAIDIAQALLVQNLFHDEKCSQVFSPDTHKYFLTGGAQAQKYVQFTEKPTNNRSFSVEQVTNDVVLNIMMFNVEGHMPYFFKKENNFNDSPRCSCQEPLLTMPEGGEKRLRFEFELNRSFSGLYMVPGQMTEGEFRFAREHIATSSVVCPNIMTIGENLGPGIHRVDFWHRYSTFFAMGGRRSKLAAFFRDHHQRRTSMCPSASRRQKKELRSNSKQSITGTSTDSGVDSKSTPRSSIKSNESLSVSHQDSSAILIPASAKQTSSPTHPQIQHENSIPEDDSAMEDSGEQIDRRPTLGVTPAESLSSGANEDEREYDDDDDDEDEGIQVDEKPAPKLDAQSSKASVISNTSSSSSSVKSFDLPSARSLLSKLAKQHSKSLTDDNLAELVTGEDGSLTTMYVYPPCGLPPKMYKHFRKVGSIYTTRQLRVVDSNFNTHFIADCTGKLTSMLAPRMCDHCRNKLTKCTAMRKAGNYEMCPFLGEPTANNQNMPAWRKHLAVKLNARDRSQRDNFAGLIEMHENLLFQKNQVRVEMPEPPMKRDSSFSATGSSLEQTMQHKSPVGKFYNAQDILQMHKQLSVGAVTMSVTPRYFQSSDGLKLKYFAYENSKSSAVAANVVLMPGLIISYNFLNPMAEQLSRDFGVNVYVLMPRGHGGSEGQPGHTPHKHQMLDDLRMLVRLVKWNTPPVSPGVEMPLILGGFQAGATIVIKYAGWSERESVSAYTLISPQITEFMQENKRTQTPADKMKLRINSATRGKLMSESIMLDLESRFQGLDNPTNESFPTQITVALMSVMTIRNGEERLKKFDRPFSMYVPEDDETMDVHRIVKCAKSSPVSNKHIEIVEGVTSFTVLQVVPELVGVWIRSAIAP